MNIGMLSKPMIKLNRTKQQHQIHSNTLSKTIPNAKEIHQNTHSIRSAHTKQTAQNVLNTQLSFDTKFRNPQLIQSVDDCARHLRVSLAHQPIKPSNERAKIKSHIYIYYTPYTSAVCSVYTRHDNAKRSHVHVNNRHTVNLSLRLSCAVLCCVWCSIHELS